ncbi:MAG: hypothetical protein Q9219_006696 [cf. Caloplaca sp. 3 TL-2023]
MAPEIINILLTSFSGLGLPPTLSLPVSSTISVAELRALLIDHLPQSHHPFIFTTNSNKELSASSSALLSNFLSIENDTFVPVRLSIPLCGGKGGFGSQLRAAGGRMSSRRKRNQGNENSSNRNLDGRRLRTVAEAKALAEYLALKPKMVKKEKEARHKRWEQVIELAEKKEEEIKSGSKGRIEGKWTEDKDEAGERARDAVATAMKSGQYRDTLSYSRLEETGTTLSMSSQSRDEDDQESPKSKTIPSPAMPSLSRTFFGFDDNDEEISSDEDNGEENGNMT